jgi:LPXTG-motif cell wall-anchored protein
MKIGKSAMRYEVEAEVTRLGILAGLTALIVGVAWLTLKRRKPKGKSEDE